MASRSLLVVLLATTSRYAGAFLSHSQALLIGGGTLDAPRTNEFPAFKCRSKDVGTVRLSHNRPTFRMAMDGQSPKTKKNLGSYYRRPSAAIEQGGGFFVPGLEGFRLRFLLAVIILGLLSLEGLSRPGISTSEIVSKALAAIAGFALLGQAFLDQQKEQAVQKRREALDSDSTAAGENATAPGEAKISFCDSAALGPELEDRIMWAADILLQLTAGCSLVAFSGEIILARIGTTGGESDDVSVVALASKKAATRDDGSSIIITNPPAYQGDGIDSINGDGNDSDGENTKNNATIMQLLPSACRQGILCRVSTPLPGEGVVGMPDEVVVLLGSTLGGTGVFSGADGAWFERVCAHLALGNESSRR